MMDLSTVQDLKPLVIALAIGVFAGWLAYRNKLLFAVLLFVTFISLGFFGKNLMPTIHLKDVSPMEIPGLLWGGFSDLAQKLILVTFAAAILTRLIIAAFVSHARRKGPETRRDMRSRVYKDFAYQDDMTRAIQSGKRTAREDVIPWVGQDPRSEV